MTFARAPQHLAGATCRQWHGSVAEGVQGVCPAAVESLAGDRVGEPHLGDTRAPSVLPVDHAGVDPVGARDPSQTVRYRSCARAGSKGSACGARPSCHARDVTSTHSATDGGGSSAQVDQTLSGKGASRRVAWFQISIGIGCVRRRARRTRPLVGFGTLGWPLTMPCGDCTWPGGHWKGGMRR